MAIRFFSDDIAFKLKEKRKIASWLKSIVLEEEKIIESINYVFVSNEAILKLNNEFLKHNYFTDILTFSHSSSALRLSGDMYISIDTVESNAIDYKVDFKNELLRVILHGLLHLCGYKDITKSEKKQMRKLENKYLKKYYAITTI